MVFGVVLFPKDMMSLRFKHAVGFGVADGVMLVVHFAEGVDVGHGATIFGGIVARENFGKVAPALVHVAHGFHLPAHAILKVSIVGRRSAVVVLDAVHAGVGRRYHGYRFYCKQYFFLS